MFNWPGPCDQGPGDQRWITGRIIHPACIEKPRPELPQTQPLF